KRPTRTLGLTASSSGALIPEAIRKKFSGPDGWKTHVPFQYLTDKYCSFTNHVSTKELNDFFTLDSTGGNLISTPKELAFEPELSLTFDEWFQAQGRLLELIETYHPEEHHLWVAHFNNIIYRPNRAQNWSLILEYDSQIRRRACHEGIDPSVFHLSVWNDLESVHIAKRAIATVRRELQSKPAGGKSGQSFVDTGRGSSAGRFQPYEQPKNSSSDPTHSFRSSGKRRCFVCGDDDAGHWARTCNADRLVNGKDLILIAQKPGGPRKDRGGNAICYAFNGRSGCNNGNTCTHGSHWCSLCGARNGLHCAQNCAAV
ncbi:hypothetical protein B0H11DRAFT_1727327, partial [Mycena galericulata]